MLVISPDLSLAMVRFVVTGLSWADAGQAAAILPPLSVPAYMDGAHEEWLIPRFPFPVSFSAAKQ